MRERLAGSHLAPKILYAAVFVTPEATKFVDLHFDVCPLPRMFEWNFIHHAELRRACVDIDGVLCIDPTEEQNDDGENYLRFLLEATPLYLPTFPIGCLVTSRLEKYRPQTEDWLRRRGVQYNALVMLNMASAEERRKTNCHGRFKGEVFRSRPEQFFIESNPKQAQEIAEIAGKPVFCTENREVYFPSTGAVARRLARRLPARLPSLGWRLVTRIKKRLLGAP